MVSQRETIKGFALDLVLFLFLRSKNNNKHGKQKKHVSYAFKTFGFNKGKGAYCCFGFLCAAKKTSKDYVRATKSKIFVSLRILLAFKILAVVPYFNNP